MVAKLYGNIKEICDEKVISIRQLEINTGIPENSIANWKQSRTWERHLVAIADYLEVSTDYLLGRTGNRDFHKD